MTNKNEITGTLENWWYDELNHVLWGHIFDDVRKRWPNGTRIHTSTLSLPKDRCKEEDFLNSLYQVQTRNSIYKLGRRQQRLE